MRGLSIGQAAERSGISADTLRYYERIGLLPAPARTLGNRRVYRQRDLDRLAFVQRAQAVGFSLEEIRQLVGFREDPAGNIVACIYQAVQWLDRQEGGTHQKVPGLAPVPHMEHDGVLFPRHCVSP